MSNKAYTNIYSKGTPYVNVKPSNEHCLTNETTT